MKRRFSVGCGVAAALLTAAPVWAQASPAGEPASPVRASASVDRTAVWVGDHVTYTVEIACARGFDALLDDLAKDKLHLQGFEVIGSDSSRTTAADGSTTYDVRFLLTTYQVGAPSLSVAPFSVRYYAARPGERAQDQAPAGDVQVPGVAVALRSTLPEGEAVYELRDRQVLGARGRLAAAARPIGLALVLLSLVPAVAIALAMARRGWQSAAKRSAKRARTDRRVLLAELGALDVRTDASR
ncbi:MAG TPA: BatD family protein, partial [Vicinamibacterales bacterium]